MDRVDLLIIGLGPGGAAAAAVAAEGGLTVLGIDRRPHLGEPIQCAEFVPLPLGRWAQAPGVIRQAVRRMRTYLPSGESRWTESPGLMIDRARFDRAIAGRAEAAGGRLLPATRLLDLDLARGIAWVEEGGRERQIGFRLLIAADGPHSTVARLLGLPPLPCITTRQYRVPLEQPLDELLVWLGSAYPGGYAWCFPRKSKANLGVGADKRYCGDLKRPLAALHQQLVAEGLVGETIISRTGGAIPVGGLRPQLVIGSALLVGDAAGLTHPISGAGIAAAVVSGELAGRAVVRALAGAGEAALVEYATELHEQFGPSLARAVARREGLLDGDLDADAVQRRGWFAFPEYYAEPSEGGAVTS